MIRAHGFGGVENIPFLEANADAAEVSANLWIEIVKRPGAYGKGSFLQLHYNHTEILNFRGLSWPHVSVATLRKDAYLRDA